MEIELFAFDWSGTISDDRTPVYKANMKRIPALRQSKTGGITW